MNQWYKAQKAHGRGWFFPSRIRNTAMAIAVAVLIAMPLRSEGSEKPEVVATATMISDMVASVGGERVTVHSLMGPGVDPHLYRPATSDLRRMNRADAIFYMGLFFEEQMQAVLERLSRSRGNTYAVTDAFPRERLLSSPDGEDLPDPHVWFDAELWTHAVEVVVEGLVAVDPEGRDYFEKNAEAYREELRELHEWLLEKAAELPEEKRVVVTSHDAYSYFGRAYDFQVVGLLGISTASEAGLADMTRLVDFIREREIQAIFVESSVSPRAIRRVSRDSGAEVGGELFSDALGSPGDIRKGFDVGTYNGMMRYNMTTIVEALQ